MNRFSGDTFPGVQNLRTGKAGIPGMADETNMTHNRYAIPLQRPEMNRFVNAWPIRQLESTADFARRSRVMAWLLGGLNIQIVHHLFPLICHANYPAISSFVEATWREFGVK